MLYEIISPDKFLRPFIEGTVKYLAEKQQACLQVTCPALGEGARCDDRLAGGSSHAQQVGFLFHGRTSELQ
ncbi:MAG: hypothetical protein WD002_08940 [Pseudomonadales bacterium]